LHLTAATNDVAERPDNKVAEMEKKFFYQIHCMPKIIIG